ncbi:MAG: DUF1643 domain-containing protein [Kiritimatiellia bacterium]|jgi:hypothetical protein
MHIPSRPIQAQRIRSFADALAAESSNEGGYDRARWLYVPDTYCDYRYLLGVRGERTLLCLGANPSTAVPGGLDNTLKSVSRIAASNGFDSWMMLNVYAQRATRPSDMDEAPDARLHAENLAAFRWMLAQGRARPVVWAAWGTVIEQRAYLPDCVGDLVEAGESSGAEWVCAGKRSKAGHPHHPLYLKKDEPLRPFDVRGYLAGWKVRAEARAGRPQRCRR